jgi:hypothetical protein
MGKLIAPTKPTAGARAGSGSSVCPDCKHEREGHAPLVSTNRRLLRKGKALIAPSCSSGFDMGWGDEDMCKCQNTCHSERLTTTTRHL